MTRFKRYEYIIPGKLEWCEDDMDEDKNWDEFKETINEDVFFDNISDDRAKDIIINLVITKVIEGYYDEDGNEVITKTTEL